MANYKLISFDLCPFVQRSSILLQEKGVTHEIVYIDLASKPAWFLALSPLGKVPLLQVDGTTLFESSVIAEFIDETTGDRLMPGHAIERAQHRMWIEFISSAIGTAYRLQNAADEDAVRDLAAKHRGELARLETVLGDGPLFAGDKFSLVDAAAAPLLQRSWWTHEIVPSLGLFDGLDKVTAWTKALMERPSVVRSTIPNIKERFAEYVSGRQSPTRVVDPGWVGQQIAP